jgi:alpha-L-arabinofuranosidase
MDSPRANSFFSARPLLNLRSRTQALYLSALLFSELVLPMFASDAVITIDATKPGPAVNSNMYGIFLEEINHGVDGGLYAELIRNRAFEDARPPEGYIFQDGSWRDAHGFSAGFERYGYTTNGVPFWSLVQSPGATGALHLETSGGVSPQSPTCARLEITTLNSGRVGIANAGFFGIGIKPGVKYDLSFYALGEQFAGSIFAQLEDASGLVVSTSAKVEGVSGEWKQFRVTLEGAKLIGDGRLVLSAGAMGNVWFDMVSLFPQQTWKQRPNGLRPDLAQLIADLKPGFVRFPGGCVVEAGTVATAYDWKLTVGPLEQRTERWGPWNHRRTQGMGVFEYLQFCEDLQAEPLWVGFAGQTCIFRERELVPMSGMGAVRDNFLDLVEYANGTANSPWGKLRVQAGHPASFDLKYVEIGNENQGSEFGERYRFIHDAMKARHPDITYLADLSWTSRESMGDAKFDIEDQHYYNSPRWFAARFHEYDQRDRQLPPLYLGEVAVTTGAAGPLRGNLQAALAEGVFLLGCERNADAVRMVSYAPLLGHVAGRTELTDAPPPWHAMIYFDATRAFGTVSYYLWQLFGLNHPDHTVATDVTVLGDKPPALTGGIGLGGWDTAVEFKDVRVEQGSNMLYAADFSKTPTGWRTEGGDWSVREGAYRQAKTEIGLSWFGERESWTNYTLTLKARKLAGAEGFIIAFGRNDGARLWWNLGGWGNNEHAIEFNQDGVGRHVRGSIETGRWYDIKVELADRRISCYLDGQLVHDETALPPQQFFAVAGPDALRGELVVKAINLSAQPINAELNIAGAGKLGPTARVTVLSSGRLNDNNSLTDPIKVTPLTTTRPAEGGKFSHEFPAHSLTVLRVKTR